MTVNQLLEMAFTDDYNGFVDEIYDAQEEENVKLLSEVKKQFNSLLLLGTTFSSFFRFLVNQNLIMQETY